MSDHVNISVQIPPKYAVASIVRFLKEKSAIAIAREFMGKDGNFTGEHFWARGYAVSTVGFNLEQVKAYIRAQEAEDEQGRFLIPRRSPLTEQT
jgi:putative transposase